MNPERWEHVARLHAEVARIAEVDSALRIDGQVIRRIEAMAFIAIGQHRDPAIRFGARDAAIARFANNKPLPRVEQETVCAAGVLAENLYLSARVAARDPTRSTMPTDS